VGRCAHPAAPYSTRVRERPLKLGFRDREQRQDQFRRDWVLRSLHEISLGISFNGARATLEVLNDGGDCEKVSQVPFVALGWIAENC